MKTLYRLKSELIHGLMYGLVGLFILLRGFSVSASPNLNVEGWLKNLTDSELKVIPYVWDNSARNTPSKGWIINANRQPYYVKPGQSVMFDWIYNLEINIFGEIIRGARVEFVDGKHAPLEIWFTAISRFFYKSVAANVVIAGDVIGAACIKGPVEKSTLSGSWVADGVNLNQGDFIDDATLKASARGVSYPLASPDVEFVFTKK